MEDQQTQTSQETDTTPEAVKGATFDDGEEAPTDQNTQPENNNDESGDNQSRDINQEKVDKKINKLTFEKHEEKRQHEATMQKLAQAEAELSQLKGSQQTVDIPTMPETYDPEYQRKLELRDEAIRKDAEQKAQIKAAEDRQERVKQDEATQRQATIQEQVDKMYTTGAEAGITKEEMQLAEARVAPFFKDPALAQYVLGREDSAFIVKHLNGNAEALEKIGNMAVADATAYIVTEVAPKAASLKKPGTPASSTPEPIDIPGKKKGAPEKQDPYLEGVTFE